MVAGKSRVIIIHACSDISLGHASRGRSNGMFNHCCSITSWLTRDSGEEKPICSNCQRQGEACDYSIRLNWDGRNKKKEIGLGNGTDTSGFQTISFNPQPSPSGLSLQQSSFNPVINGSNQRLAPAPTFVASDNDVALDAKSRNSSGGSSDQLLPSISNISHSMPSLPQPHHPSAPPAPVLRTPSWGDRPPLLPASNGHPNNSRLHSLSYPSPAESHLGSPSYTSNSYSFSGGSSHSMPPPTSNPSLGPDSASSPYNGNKRLRLSPRADVFPRQGSLGRSLSHGHSNVEDIQKQYFNTSTPSYFPAYLRDPLTPSTSGGPNHDPEDRRISVSSLLSEDPSDPPSRKTSSTSYPMGFDQPLPELAPRRGSLHQRMISYCETETYGHDRGLTDWDLGRNNDTMAINGGNTPSEHSDFEHWLNDSDLGIPEFGFRLESKDQAFNPGGYYASPVPIKIPKKLEPLPSTLTDNPMNLLYFHHFLNHTARILVPHDCPENPFKTILPKMAVDNHNLLNLMLAYSACHRARLLGHKEPVNRIAVWVRDVFPSLRQTLEETQNAEISNANLATAIMLASLEIISPSSFGIAIPWQAHLGLARGIIRARGGPHSISRKDPVMYFLTRWLAYLDVMGSLSNRVAEEPLYEANYWQSSYDGSSAKELSLTDDDGDDDDDYTIDCLLGFTTRCIYILAQIASLARQCAPYRINSQTGTVNENWRPSADVFKKAEKLKIDLERARKHEHKQCHHHSPVLSKATLTYAPPPNQTEISVKEAEESIATNEAFHWAGKVHLLRRVCNLPKSDPEVRQAVGQIMEKLHTLRQLGSAEACSLFPIFTAGVETEDPLYRAEVLSRLKGAEGLGMCQVGRARKIMEECYKTGANWETLVKGDFFG